VGQGGSVLEFFLGIFDSVCDIDNVVLQIGLFVLQAGQTTEDDFAHCIEVCDFGVNFSNLAHAHVLADTHHVQTMIEFLFLIFERVQSLVSR